MTELSRVRFAPKTMTEIESSRIAFTAEETVEIREALNKFPAGSQISIVKVIAGHPYFCGLFKKENEIILCDNKNLVFDIGSAAKVFTCALLAQHVAEGKFGLNDDIASHLGITLNGNAVISFKQLANHTSGLPRVPPELVWQALFKGADNPYKDFDDVRLLDYLQYKLKQKKKEKCRYSNLGVGLLGYTLSHTNQCSFEGLIQQYLCDPLALTSTTTNRNTVRNQLVIGQNKKGKKVPFWDCSALTGAGGIYASTFDLAKFIIANFDESNQAFQIQRQLTYKINKQVSIALGWLSITSPERPEAPFFWHNGGTSGFSSQLMMDISNKSGLALLSNISSMYLIKGRVLENLAFKLFENTRKLAS